MLSAALGFPGDMNFGIGEDRFFPKVAATMISEHFVILDVKVYF